MRKIIFFGAGILLLMLAGVKLIRVYRPHQNAAGEPTTASLSASDLYREFVNSESSANQKWVGKIIEVHGNISSISEAGTYISIILKAAENGSVNCSIRKEDLVLWEKLKPGDLINIKGKCTGFLTDVELVDCVIKK